MYNITKTFSLCYGHRLYKDPGKCGHVHGHTAKVEVHLEGSDLDSLGMLKNFDEIKINVGKWIDENLDHHMLLNKADPLTKILSEAGEKPYTLDDNPTAENIAKLIYFVTKKSGLPVKSVTFWESPTACATYDNA